MLESWTNKAVAPSLLIFGLYIRRGPSSHPAELGEEGDEEDEPIVELEKGKRKMDMGKEKPWENGGFLISSHFPKRGWLELWHALLRDRTHFTLEN